MVYYEGGETFGSATHLGGDVPRAVVPDDDLGDHTLQPGVAQTRNDQDDILKSAPIEDNCRYSRLLITSPSGSDRTKASVFDAGVRSSVGG
jgi:hypothetical protein